MNPALLPGLVDVDLMDNVPVLRLVFVVGLKLVPASVKLPEMAALLNQVIFDNVNVPAPAPAMEGLLLEFMMQFVKETAAEEDIVKAGEAPVLKVQFTKVPVAEPEMVTG